jgi:hypothetical protein
MENGKEEKSRKLLYASSVETAMGKNYEKKKKKKKANSPKSIHITLYSRGGSRWEGHETGIARAVSLGV